MAGLADAMALLKGFLAKRNIALQDVLIILGLLLLPLLFFWPVTLGGKTLLPLDNLFAWEPWAARAAEFGVTIPHNGLLSDLVLENYAWKRFILESLQGGDLPLWNPYLFGGVPFLAAGQHSALYPLSVLYYILPLAQAYGWFTVIQLFLTGVFAFIYGRVIGLNRFGAVIAAITYTFSLFMIVQAVFPMIIAAAAWLPLLLTAIEMIVRRQCAAPARSPAPYVLLGALALGCEWLAGHVEITYFVLIVLALYSAWRLAGEGWRLRREHGPKVSWLRAVRTGLSLLTMVLLGTGLAAIQVVPLYELVRTSFRQGSASLDQVLGWAYPKRRLLAWFMPDFYGNPTHHTYFDVLRRVFVPVTRNVAGDPITTIDWGIKNYVEGAVYVGILPLFLALIGMAGWGWPWGKRRAEAPAVERPGGRTYVGFYAALSAFSLLLVFGTPLYALIYHLPGLSQSHSPFRWVFPLTFSLSVLAGCGAWYLSSAARRVARLRRALGWVATLGGAALLAGLGASLLAAERVIPLAERVMLRLAQAPQAFADGRVFYSYQFGNLAVLGVLLVATGAVLLLARGAASSRRWGGLAPWQALAALLLVADLWWVGHGFNTAADPAILEIEHPLVEFLQSDPEPYRITVFDTRSAKPFIANVGMYYDLQDIRGYDSIIPKRYTDYMGLIEEQGELLYNRVARLRYPESLDSPLLDLLNVKYVITAETIDRSGYTLVYDGELRVYRNDDYMPRAFIVYEAEVLPDEPSLFARLRAFDPRRVALFEQAPELALGQAPGGAATGSVSIASYGLNEVELDVTLPVTGVVVLADSHFPDWSKAFQGWKAYDTTPGAEEEREVGIYRVDGNFRGFVLPPGEHHLRVRYTPMSLKFGLFVSFICAAMLLLLAITWAWQRYYHEEDGGDMVRRVAKNTGASVLLTLLNRAVDMAFAMFMLRILGPENAGKQTFAIVLVTWFEILTNFGLNTLLTRDVARDRLHASRYLANTTSMRLGLCTIALPLVVLVSLGWRAAFGLTTDTIIAILLWFVSLFPSGVSAGLSAVFNAYEKMEYPAMISTLTTFLKVAGGTVVLLLGWGFVGLAGVSIVVSLLTMLILLVAVSRICCPLRLEFDRKLQKQMFVEAYPLMLNHLLATLFFKVDVTLLQAMKGNVAVGYYGAAYKPIDALTIIPSYFTMAVFPIMARFATSARDSLMRAYQVAVRFLLLLAVPIAITVFFAAEPLIYLLGGSGYLPDSMMALRLLIGFLPFSFINGVTQYVLIALEQQRFLTKAFLIGFAFNLLANLIFIPRFSYQASAIIHIFAEVALMIPFYYGIRKHLGSVPWLALTWQPVVAGAAMAAVLLVLRNGSLVWTLPLGLLVYAGLLVALGTFGEQERALLRGLVKRRDAGGPV